MKGKLKKLVTGALLATFAAFGAGSVWAGEAPADATGTPSGITGDVMIVEIKGAGETWPVTYLEQVDLGKFNCEAYKTGKIVLAKIPANANGYFCDPGCGTKHPITKKLPVACDYWMGLFEVTVAQYENVMGVSPASSSLKPKANIVYGDIRGSADPAVNPSVASDASFMKTLCERCKDVTGAREMLFDLPTEAQWEIACRAGTASSWCMGEEGLSGYAVYSGKQGSGTSHPLSNVGSKKSNNWGLYDMHGNVWEWCRDAYAAFEAQAAEEYQPVADTSESGINVNSRMERGGCWRSGYDNCRSSTRNDGSKADADVGFRLSSMLKVARVISADGTSTNDFATLQQALDAAQNAGETVVALKPVADPLDLTALAEGVNFDFGTNATAKTFTVPAGTRFAVASYDYATKHFLSQVVGEDAPVAYVERGAGADPACFLDINDAVKAAADNGIVRLCRDTTKNDVGLTIAPNAIVVSSTVDLMGKTMANGFNIQSKESTVIFTNGTIGTVSPTTQLRCNTGRVELYDITGGTYSQFRAENRNNGQLIVWSGNYTNTGVYTTGELTGLMIRGGKYGLDLQANFDAAYWTGDDGICTKAFAMTSADPDVWEVVDAAAVAAYTVSDDGTVTNNCTSLQTAIDALDDSTKTIHLKKDVLNDSFTVTDEDMIDDLRLKLDGFKFTGSSISGTKGGVPYVSVVDPDDTTFNTIKLAAESAYIAVLADDATVRFTDIPTALTAASGTPSKTANLVCDVTQAMAKGFKVGAPCDAILNLGGHSFYGYNVQAFNADAKVVISNGVLEAVNIGADRKGMLTLDRVHVAAGAFVATNAASKLILNLGDYRAATFDENPDKRAGINIFGGLFNYSYTQAEIEAMVDREKVCHPSLVVIQAEADGAYCRQVLRDGYVIAEIVEKLPDGKYTLLQTALDAAADGQTVRMANDTVEDALVRKSLTLDMDVWKLYGSVTADAAKTVTLTNANLTGALVARKDAKLVFMNGTNTCASGAFAGAGKIEIHDGTFSQEPAAELIFNSPDRVAANNGDGTWTIVDRDDIAFSITEGGKTQLFTDVGTAIKVAKKDGPTLIVFEKDFSGDIDVKDHAISKNLRFNTNGKTFDGELKSPGKVMATDENSYLYLVDEDKAVVAFADKPTARFATVAAALKIAANEHTLVALRDISEELTAGAAVTNALDLAGFGWTNGCIKAGAAAELAITNGTVGVLVYEKKATIILKDVTADANMAIEAYGNGTVIAYEGDYTKATYDRVDGLVIRGGSYSEDLGANFDAAYGAENGLAFARTGDSLWEVIPADRIVATYNENDPVLFYTNYEQAVAWTDPVARIDVAPIQLYGTLLKATTTEDATNGVKLVRDSTVAATVFDREVTIDYNGFALNAAVTYLGTAGRTNTLVNVKSDDTFTARKGGTILFKSGTSTYEFAFAGDVKLENGTFSYKHDEKKHVIGWPERVLANNNDGTWTIVDTNSVVCFVDGEAFVDFADAICYATEDTSLTIELAKDCNEVIYLKSQNITPEKNLKFKTNGFDFAGLAAYEPAVRDQYVQATNDDGTWTLVPKAPIVAEIEREGIGTLRFTKLQTAVDAALENEAVNLVSNTVEDVTVGDKTIVIDFAATNRLEGSLAYAGTADKTNTLLNALMTGKLTASNAGVLWFENGTNTCAEAFEGNVLLKDGTFGYEHDSTFIFDNANRTMANNATDPASWTIVDRTDLVAKIVRDGKQESFDEYHTALRYAEFREEIFLLKDLTDTVYVTEDEVKKENVWMLNGQSLDGNILFADGYEMATVDGGKGRKLVIATAHTCVNARTDVKYLSLKLAIDEATDGDVIRMLTDRVVDIAIPDGKLAVKIDPNGFAFKGEMTHEGYLMATDGNGCLYLAEEENVVAQIVGRKDPVARFEQVNDALTATTNGETVALLRDAGSGHNQIKFTKAATNTLDLADNKWLAAGVGNLYAIKEPGANLTIANGNIEGLLRVDSGAAYLADLVATAKFTLRTAASGSIIVESGDYLKAATNSACGGVKLRGGIFGEDWTCLLDTSVVPALAMAYTEEPGQPAWFVTNETDVVAEIVGAKPSRRFASWDDAKAYAFNGETIRMVNPVNPLDLTGLEGKDISISFGTNAVPATIVTATGYLPAVSGVGDDGKPTWKVVQLGDCVAQVKRSGKDPLYFTTLRSALAFAQKPAVIEVMKSFAENLLVDFPTTNTVDFCDFTVKFGAPTAHGLQNAAADITLKNGTIAGLLRADKGAYWLDGITAAAGFELRTAPEGRIYLVDGDYREAGLVEDRNSGVKIRGGYYGQDWTDWFDEEWNETLEVKKCFARTDSLGEPTWEVIDLDGAAKVLISDDDSVLPRYFAADIADETLVAEPYFAVLARTNGEMPTQYYQSISNAQLKVAGKLAGKLICDRVESVVVEDALNLDLNGKKLSREGATGPVITLGAGFTEKKDKLEITSGKKNGALEGNLNLGAQYETAGSVEISKVDLGAAQINNKAPSTTQITIRKNVRSSYSKVFNAQEEYLKIMGIGSLFNANQDRFAGEGRHIVVNEDEDTKDAYKYVVVKEEEAKFLNVRTGDLFLSDKAATDAAKKGDTLQLLATYTGDLDTFLDDEAILKLLRFELPDRSFDDMRYHFFAIRHNEMYLAREMDGKLVFIRRNPPTRKLSFVIEGKGGVLVDGKEIAHQQTGTETVIDYAELKFLDEETLENVGHRIEGVPTANGGDEFFAWYSNTANTAVLTDPNAGDWIRVTYDAVMDDETQIGRFVMPDEDFVLKAVFKKAPIEKGALTIAVEPAGAAAGMQLDDWTLTTEDDGATFVTNNVKADTSHILFATPKNANFANVTWLKDGMELSTDNPYAAFGYAGVDTVVTAKFETVATITCDPVEKVYDGIPTNLTVVVDGWQSGEPTIKYSEDGATWLDKIEKTDAGEYDIQWKVTDADGFEHARGLQTITIKPFEVTAAEITLDPDTFEYDGTEHEPAIASVVIDGVTLEPGVDYDPALSYADNQNAGTATATVFFKGNYKGEATANFTITPKPLTADMVTLTKGPCYVWAGVDVEPEFTVQDYGILTDGDWTSAYENNDVPSTLKKQAAVVVTGQRNYTGEVRKPFTILDDITHVVKKTHNVSETAGKFWVDRTQKDPDTGIIPVVIYAIDKDVLEYEVPDTFKKDGKTYQVVGIANGAFTNAPSMLNLKIDATDWTVDGETKPLIRGNIVEGLVNLQHIDFAGTTWADSPYYFQKLGEEFGGAGVLVKCNGDPSVADDWNDVTLLGVTDAADVFTVSNVVTKIVETAFRGNPLLKEIALPGTLQSIELAEGDLDLEKTIFSTDEDPATTGLDYVIGAIDLTWFKESDNRWITIDVEGAEAKIVSLRGAQRYYMDFTNAVANARNGETVVVLTNLTQGAKDYSVRIIGKKVVIDAEGWKFLGPIPINLGEGGELGIIGGTFDWNYEVPVNYLVPTADRYPNPVMAYNGDGTWTVTNRTDVLVTLSGEGVDPTKEVFTDLAAAFATATAGQTITFVQQPSDPLDLTGWPTDKLGIKLIGEAGLTVPSVINTPEGYKPVRNVDDKTVSLAANEDVAAQIARGSGKTPKYYRTVADALSEAVKNENVRLLKDCGEELFVTEAKVNTIGLNGFAWTNGFVQVRNADAKITIQNGTFASPVRVNKGTVVLKNVTAEKGFRFNAPNENGLIYVKSGDYAVPNSVVNATGVIVQGGRFSYDFLNSGNFDDSNGTKAFVRLGKKLWEVQDKSAVIASIYSADSTVSYYNDIRTAITLAKDGEMIGLMADCGDLVLTDGEIAKQLKFKKNGFALGTITAQRHNEFYEVVMAGDVVRLVAKDMPTHRITFFIEGAGRVYVDGKDARHLDEGGNPVDWTAVSKRIVSLKPVVETDSKAHFYAWYAKDAHGEWQILRDADGNRIGYDGNKGQKDGELGWVMEDKDVEFKVVFWDDATYQAKTPRTVEVKVETNAVCATAVKLDGVEGTLSGDVWTFEDVKFGAHTIEAPAAEGYVFVGWKTNDVLVSTEKLEVEVNDDLEGVTARFIGEDFDITGTVVAGEIEKTYDREPAEITVNVTGLAEGDYTVQYTIDGVTWTEEAPEFIDENDSYGGDAFAWRVIYGTDEGMVLAGGEDEGYVDVYVHRKDIAEADVSATLGTNIQQVGADDPDVTVTYLGTDLVREAEFSVAYSGEAAPATRTATVTGVGNYKGTRELQYAVVGQTTIDGVTYYIQNDFESSGNRAAVALAEGKSGEFTLPKEIKVALTAGSLKKTVFTVVDIVPGAFTNSPEITKLVLKDCDQLNIWGNIIWGLEKLEYIDFPGATPDDSEYYYSKLAEAYNGAGVLVKRNDDANALPWDDVTLLGVAAAGDEFEVSNVVTKIAKTAFFGNDKLERIVLHNGIRPNGIEEGFTEELDLSQVVFVMNEEPSDDIKAMFAKELDADGNPLEWSEAPDGTWVTFNWATAEAMIETQLGAKRGFQTFEAAKDAAREGETVTVLRDITGDVTLERQLTVTTTNDDTKVDINFTNADQYLQVVRGVYNTDYTANLVERDPALTMERFYDENEKPWFKVIDVTAVQAIAYTQEDKSDALEFTTLQDAAVWVEKKSLANATIEVVAAKIEEDFTLEASATLKFAKETTWNGVLTAKDAGTVVKVSGFRANTAGIRKFGVAEGGAITFDYSPAQHAVADPANYAIFRADEFTWILLAKSNETARDTNDANELFYDVNTAAKFADDVTITDEDNAQPVTAEHEVTIRTADGVVWSGTLDANGQTVHTVEGSVFGNDLSDQLALEADGLLLANNGDDTWTAVAKDDIYVEIDGQNYRTLADAAVAAEAGDTLKIVRDGLNEDVTFDKSVTFDINGKDWTGTLTALGDGTKGDVVVTVKNGAVADSETFDAGQYFKVENEGAVKFDGYFPGQQAAVDDEANDTDYAVVHVGDGQWMVLDYEQYVVAKDTATQGNTEDLYESMQFASELAASADITVVKTNDQDIDAKRDFNLTVANGVIWYGYLTHHLCKVTTTEYSTFGHNLSKEFNLSLSGGLAFVNNGNGTWTALDKTLVVAKFIIEDPARSGAPEECFTNAETAVSALTNPLYGAPLDSLQIGLNDSSLTYDFGGLTNAAPTEFRILAVGEGENTIKNLTIVGKAAVGGINSESTVIFDEGVRMPDPETKFVQGKVTLIIRKGAYVNDPSEYCEDGYAGAQRAKPDLTGMYVIYPEAEIAVTVGNVHYRTLQDAFDLAASGSKIELFNNLTNDNVALSRTATLTGKSFTLTRKSAGVDTIRRTNAATLIEVGANAELKLENIVFDGANVASTKPMIAVKATGKLVVGDKLEMKGAKGGAVDVANNGRIEINGSASQIWDNNGKNVVLANQQTGLVLVKDDDGDAAGGYNPCRIGIWCANYKAGQQFGTVDLTQFPYPMFCDGDISVAKPAVYFTNDRDATLHHGMGAGIAGPANNAISCARWTGGFKDVLEEGNFLISRTGNELVWLARQTPPVEDDDNSYVGSTKGTITLNVAKGNDYALVTEGIAFTNWMSATGTTLTFEHLKNSTTYTLLKRKSITKTQIVSDFIVNRADITYRSEKYNAKEIAQLFDPSDITRFENEATKLEVAENAAVTVTVADNGRGYVVTLKKDLHHGVDMWDDLGPVKIDLKGSYIDARTGGDEGILIKAATDWDDVFPTELDIVNSSGSGRIAKIVGAAGADGDATDADGKDGATGIRNASGNMSYVTVNGFVEVYGGKGGNGANRTNGQAGNGGAGGDAIKGIIDLTVNGGALFGGNGGNGGESTNGVGGNGGNGGAGVGDDVTGTVVTGGITGGNGGNGGGGAAAGNGGNGGDGFVDLEKMVLDGDAFTGEIEVIAGKGGLSADPEKAGQDGKGGKPEAPAAPTVKYLTGESVTLNVEPSTEYLVFKTADGAPSIEKQAWIKTGPQETAIYVDRDTLNRVLVKDTSYTVWARTPAKDGNLVSYYSEMTFTTLGHDASDLVTLFKGKATAAEKDGIYVVTLTDDIKEGLEIPDNLGVFKLDMQGWSITGRNGNAAAGELDGEAAITFTAANDDPSTLTRMIIIGNGDNAIVGGNGDNAIDSLDDADGDNGGEGGNGFAVADNLVKRVVVDFENGTLAGGNGGKGADSVNGNGGDGGNGGDAYDDIRLTVVIGRDALALGGNGGKGGDVYGGIAGNGGNGGNAMRGEGGNGGQRGIARGAGGQDGQDGVGGDGIIPGGAPEAYLVKLTGASHADRFFTTFEEGVLYAENGDTLTVVRDCVFDSDDYGEVEVTANDLTIATAPGVTLTWNGTLRVASGVTGFEVEGEMSEAGTGTLIVDGEATLGKGMIANLEISFEGQVELRGATVGKVAIEQGGRLTVPVNATSLIKEGIVSDQGGFADKSGVFLFGGLYGFDPGLYRRDPFMVVTEGNLWRIVQDPKFTAMAQVGTKIWGIETIDEAFAEIRKAAGPILVYLLKDSVANGVLTDQAWTDAVIIGNGYTIVDARKDAACEVALFNLSGNLVLRNVTFDGQGTQKGKFIELFEAKTVTMDGCTVTGYACEALNGVDGKLQLISAAAAGMTTMLVLKDTTISGNDVSCAVSLTDRSGSGFEYQLLLSGATTIADNGGNGIVANRFGTIVMADDLTGGYIDVAYTGLADGKFGLAANKYLDGADHFRSEATKECGSVVEEGGKAYVKWGVDERQYAAQIGNKLYETIEEALEAVQDGDTLTLMQDAEITRTVTVRLRDSNESFTLDLNGKTLTNSANKLKFGTGTVTIRNGTLAKNDTKYALYLYGAAVQLEDVTVDSDIYVARGWLVIGDEDVKVKGVIAKTNAGSISISEGLYTENPSEYVVSGHTVAAGSYGEYAWKVVPAAEPVGFADGFVLDTTPDKDGNIALDFTTRDTFGVLRDGAKVILNGYVVNKVSVETPKGWKSTVTYDPTNGKTVVLFAMDNAVLKPELGTDNPGDRPFEVVTAAGQVTQITLRVKNAVKGFWYQLMAANDLGQTFQVATEVQATQDGNLAITLKTSKDKFFKLNVSDRQAK